MLMIARCLGEVCFYVNGLMELPCPLETSFGLRSSALSSAAVETENAAP